MNWLCRQCDFSRFEGGPGEPCPTHGGTLVRADVAQSFPHDPLLGKTLDGRYALYDVLGRGGMGAVYRGRHLKLGRDVAVKTIRTGDREQHPDFDVRERFFLEARMLAGLRNPGIVSLLDYGEDQGLLYMVLELLEGVTLHALLRGRARLVLPRAIDFAVGMLQALGEPHRTGLVHRDIKPSNIMVRTKANGQESVTLIDFGVAKVIESDDEELSGPATRTGLTIGTPRYMSPEQLAHEAVGPWSDQYAVSIVLYRMLAGQTPFIGPPAVVVAAHLREPPPPFPPELGIPPAVEAVILRALSKEPADRYESCALMAEALREAMLHGVAPTPVSLPPVVMPTDAPTVEVPAEEVEPDPESMPLTPPWRGEVAPTADDPKEPRSRKGLIIGAMLASAVGVFFALNTLAPIPEPKNIRASTAPAVVVQIPNGQMDPVIATPVSHQTEIAKPVEMELTEPIDLSPPSVPALPSTLTSAPPKIRPRVRPKASASVAPKKPKSKTVRRTPPKPRAPKKAPPSAPPSAVTTRAAPRPTGDPVAQFRRALSACRCDAAKLALDSVPLDQEAGLRRSFRARCAVVGLGCNAPESP